MAISDDIQREMPTAKDRKNARKLAFKEAVLLTNPSNPRLKGEVIVLVVSIFELYYYYYTI